MRVSSELYEINVAAVMPALNESRSIGSVVASVSNYALPIVVDDGSTDSTVVVARYHGAHVVSHNENKGYEAALVTGFKVATELGMSYVITLDADGQHDPEIIKRFVDELLSGADIVVGQRHRLQRIGEYLFSIIGSLIWGIKDPLCGMKAYKIECVQPIESFNNYDSVGSKFAIVAARNGKKITNLKLTTKPRDGSSRFGCGWRANKRIIIAIYHSIKEHSR